MISSDVFTDSVSLSRAIRWRRDAESNCFFNTDCGLSSVLETLVTHYELLFSHPGSVDSVLLSVDLFTKLGIVFFAPGDFALACSGEPFNTAFRLLYLRRTRK